MATGSNYYDTLHNSLFSTCVLDIQRHVLELLYMQSWRSTMFSPLQRLACSVEVIVDTFVQIWREFCFYCTKFYWRVTYWVMLFISWIGLFKTGFPECVSILFLNAFSPHEYHCENPSFRYSIELGDYFELPEFGKEFINPKFIFNPIQ